VLTAELSFGDHFEKAIGAGLVFRVDPARLVTRGELDGWSVTLVPLREPKHDYIYPVNPPLRSNGLQILGPSYGDDTRVRLDMLTRCASCYIQPTMIGSHRW